MHDRLTFEARLAAAMERYADGAPTEVEPLAYVRAIAAARRGPAIVRAGLVERGGILRWRPAARLGLVLATALLVVVLIGTALIVGGRIVQQGPSPVPSLPSSLVLTPSPQPSPSAIESPEPSPFPRFRATGSLGTPRFGHAATRLSDGRVLVVGGAGTDHWPVASAEIYDPVTETFAPTGSLTRPRAGNGLTALLLPDGRVLIDGGSGNGGPLVGPELFDPASGAFTSLTETGASLGLSPVVLADGRVLYFMRGYGPASIFDVQLKEARSVDWNVMERPVALRLADGRVIAFEGLTQPPSTVRASIFDPMTLTVTDLGDLGAGHPWPIAALPDGRVLLAGGTDSPGFDDAHGPAGAEIFDPVTGAFTTVGLPTSTGDLEAVGSLPDGRIGVISRDVPQAPEIFDPLIGTFTTLGPLVAPRSDATTTVLSDGRILVAGGAGNDETAMASAGLFSPSPASTPSAQVSAAGPMATGRADFTATVLRDGRVLVSGGWSVDDGPDGKQSRPVALAELFDPQTGAFSPTGPMVVARASHTATLLADGRVLITGGAEGGPYGITHGPLGFDSA